jgi:hypothetical protein
MKRPPLLACVVLGLLLSCGCRKPKPVVDVVGDGDTPGEFQHLDCGLSDAEREEFYHLTMGSELIPLAWLRALQSESTGKPFLEEVERFGLLADPKNPDGLPIGLTAAASRDPRFNVRMVGLNCAVCHVGEVSHDGKRVRLDGAPSLFDTDAFARDLVGSVAATLKDPASFLAFLARVREDKEHASALAKARPKAAGLLSAFPSLDSLRKAGELERNLAARLESVLAEEGKQAPADLGKAGGTLRQLVGHVRHGELEKIAAGQPGADSPLAGLKTVGEREAAVKEWLDHVVETVRLLKARGEFARKVIAESKRGLPVTAAGPGRADDFGLARNLLFDADQAGPLTAPCSVPHLWGLARVTWTDWDATTTSPLSRSVATALAGGAVFDPNTHRSTLAPKNLARLDEVAVKIKSPVWPEAVLGKIDRAKADRGAALFKAHCVKCHGTGAADSPSVLIEQKELGTDPARLDNYHRKLGDREFFAALGETVAKYFQQACKDDGIEAEKLNGGRPDEWRATNGYVARPLWGVWATAPYLHNGSVPTLYHLLLPADRPKTFPLGHRDFDPARVGYTADVDKPRFTFDVSKVGNSNSGHEYGAALGDEQRYELIEYLKTL